MKFYCAILLLLSSFPVMSAFLPKNRPFDVQHYKVTLEINPASDPRDFTASAEIRAKANSAINKFSLDIDELTIAQVELLAPLKKSLAFESKGGKEVTIQLPKSLKAGESFTVRLGYRGNIQSSHYGFFKVTDPDAPERGPLLFTHFESEAARRLLPCNDEPYDKASTEVVVRVPARYQVVSNGKLVKDSPFSKGKESWREVQWLQEKPHPTYLISLAIAPFEKINTQVNGKELSVYISPKKVDRAKYVLDITKQSYLFFEKYLGVPYPWDKYATIGLPTFLWGGMENTSATHMNEERTVLNDPNSAYEKKRILALAAHELAHQWFGNLVTMKWWDDLWLNESFATIMETWTTKAVMQTDEAELELVLDAWDDYFRQEDGPRSHPIVDKALTSADDAFDSINYTKGANVLRMLNFYLGEEKFRQAVKSYLEAAAYGNATYQDFFSAAEKASGQKLKAFSDSWLLQRGYPVITYGGAWDKKTNSYRLKITQRPNHKTDSHLFVFRLPVTFHRVSSPSYAKEAVLSVEKAEHELSVELLAPPEWVSVNNRSVVLAKVVPAQLDENSLALQLEKDPDPFSRMWAAYTFVNPLIEGGSLTPIAENSLVKTLTSDPSPYVRNALLQGLKRMKARWLPRKLGDNLYELARRVLDPDPELAVLRANDPHGWSQFRSLLLGTLGKVDRPEIIPLLALVLGREGLPLDDLGEAAYGIASTGDPKGPDVLRAALKVHSKRGYRYQFLVQYAFGAYENPAAAAELKEIAKTAGSDFMGRIGWVIRNNQTLKNSREWSHFLKEFSLENARFGDEVKTRLLETIEDVKAPHIKEMLEALSTQSKSERIREHSKKILTKNYSQG